MAVIYIVALIGVLVFVHEFGHYLAARLFGVKVLVFSIGFGPRLFGFKAWGTDWDVRLLPLGGYVRMYGTEFEEVTDRADPDFSRAYNNKRIWQKAVINFAGPLFNLLLPIPILFAVIGATVVDDMPAQVGQVLDESPATGVLQPGDMVRSVNGHSVRFWTGFRDIIAEHPNEALRLGIERDGEAREVAVTPKSVTLRDAMDIMTQTVGRIGITPDLAPAVIGVTSQESVAARSGLKTFDEIISINGVAVESYVDVEHQLKRQRGAYVISVLRPVDLDVPYGKVSVLAPVEVHIDEAVSDAASLGVAESGMFLSQVDKDSPADKAGLRVGDRIVALDGVSVNIFRSFIDRLAQAWEVPHTLTVERDGEVFSTTIQLEQLTITGEFQEEVQVIYSGFYNRTSFVMPQRVPMTLGERLGHAASSSIELTYHASTMLVVYIGRMFQGKVSTKALGGPIMIGHMASKAGEEGFDVFLRMLAIISINLGIINLLPIPLFDGGKLAILLVEAIRRGPLSMRTRQVIAYIGLALVALLIMLAFKNDLERMWNLFFS